jgi:hypothetical protein
MDLHRVRLESKGAEPRGLETFDATAAGVSVFFRALTARICTQIQQADLVVGCVAWLTHPTILQTLTRVPHGVALVVQKEDFLRPDIGTPARNPRQWKQELRRAYEALPWGPLRYDYPSPLSDCCYLNDASVQPVRCMGNHNSEQSPASPRMHNKFLVFCRVRPWGSDQDDGDQIVPYAVWTGSFNFTRNAVLSLENAVLITIPAIVQAYFQEWAQIEAFSEPLDWSYPWTCPEWRLGS